MPAEQRLRRRVHRRGVERRWHVPDPAGQQRRPRAAVQDAVAVGAADRGEARRSSPPAPAPRRSTTTGCGFMWKFSASRTVRGGSVAGSVELRHLALGMHAGIGAAGDDAGRPARRRSAARPRPPAPPAPRARSPGAASRRTAPPSYSSSSAQRGISSSQRVPAGTRMPAQEAVGRPSRARPGRCTRVSRSAPRRRRPVSRRPAPSRARPTRRPARPPAPSAPSPRSVVKVPGQGLNARTCRSSAGRVARPVDAARRRASASGRRSRPPPAAAPAAASRPARAGSAARPARPARRAASPRSSSAPIGTASRSSIGPVSSPASICMMVTPVSASPARIAAWIGAAPRQRGSRLAWMFRQPRRGASSIACGRISP